MDEEILHQKILVSKTLVILARNLFRHFFTVEELKTRSLYGRKSNAVKNDDILPELDSTRRDAIISEC
jgi:hypothetical protein